MSELHPTVTASFGWRKHEPNTKAIEERLDLRALEKWAEELLQKAQIAGGNFYLKVVAGEYRRFGVRYPPLIIDSSRGLDVYFCAEVQDISGKKIRLNFILVNESGFQIHPKLRHLAQTVKIAFREEDSDTSGELKRVHEIEARLHVLRQQKKIFLSAITNTIRNVRKVRREIQELEEEKKLLSD